MKKKKLFVNATMSAVVLLTLAIAGFSHNGGDAFIGRGGSTPFSIVLGTNKNKIGEEPYSSGLAYSGSGAVTTELGNSIAFEYNSLYNPTDMWQTINAGGYVTNTQPITGMTGISLTKNNSNANFTLYWSSINVFSEERAISVDETSPLTISTDFGGFLPNYIKILAITDSDIQEGLIEFSCMDNYPPLAKGDKIPFGTYPQSKVMDSGLITSLNSGAGTLPDSSNGQSWTDYGYYISSSVTSYMWYIDLVSGSDEYRGVYFTSYRPENISNPSSTSNSFQDENGYNTNNVYWFKYEPISWRVLDIQGDKAFLMAELVLDSQDYHYSTSTRTIGGSTIYSNNYQESHIRAWLNDNFYNTAFSNEEKTIIQTTVVDNSVISTGYNPNQYACPNTNDKVFLLSYVEATSATYGLSTSASRQFSPSAYAQSQGVYKNSNGFNWWWLRSANSSMGHFERSVSYIGDINRLTINFSSYGVVPALWISL